MNLLAPLAAAAAYAPVGLKYLMLVLVTLASARAIGRRPGGWRALLRSPSFLFPAALAAWLLLSVLWTRADWPLVVTHEWTYCLPLAAAVIAAGCSPRAALHALMAFALVSALVGAASALHGGGPPPDSDLLESTVSAKGNQRIATSLLLALGAAFACWLAGRVQARWPARLLFAAAALLSGAGLLSQDRRSGLVLLPLLLLAWALAAPRRHAVRLALVALVLASVVAVWFGSSSVRARFDEGRRELQSYTRDGAATTSWGQRVRMAQITAEMVRERPLVGHGVGSWIVLWTERTPPGTRLWDNTTPHNEYLMVASQGGLVAALLLLAGWGAMMWQALRAGADGRPALMAWLALAATGIGNAVLRDAKLALPLLLLAGLATALTWQAHDA